MINREECFKQIQEIIEEWPELLSEKTIDNAKLFINSIPDDICNPHHIAEIEQWAAIDFEWYARKNYLISVTIDEKYDLICAWIMGSDSGNCVGKMENNKIPDNILDLIRKVNEYKR
jgi:hypothetical protein